jgi:hypothetical protein
MSLNKTRGNQQSFKANDRMPTILPSNHNSGNIKNDLLSTHDYDNNILSSLSPHDAKPRVNQMILEDITDSPRLEFIK